MKRALSIGLASMMIMQLSVVGMAADGEVTTPEGTTPEVKSTITEVAGNGTTPAVLNQQAPNFNVTVPGQLPVWVDEEGNVTVATDVMLRNETINPVMVVSIGIEAINGWTLKHGSVTNKIGKKEFTLNVDTKEKTIPGKQSTNIVYSSTVSPQREDINEVMALVNFLVDWDAIEDRDLYIDGQNIVAKDAEAPLMAVSKSNAKIKNWSTSDDSVLALSYNASDPTNVIVTGKKPGVAEVTVVDEFSLESKKSITVREMLFDHIEITAQPNKLNYVIGDMFNPTGMVVTAVYTDGTRVDVRGYTYDKQTQLDVDNNIVTISYTEASKTETADVTVTVDPDTKKVNYIVANDNDFQGDKDGEWRYIGKKAYIEIPYSIKRQPVHNISHMFSQNEVIRGVKCTKWDITHAAGAFNNTKQETLLLDFNFYNISQAGSMFQGCGAKELDLSSSDWYLLSANNAGCMFLVAKATVIYAPNEKVAREFRNTSAFPDTARVIVKPK